MSKLRDRALSVSALLPPMGTPIAPAPAPAPAPAAQTPSPPATSAAAPIDQAATPSASVEDKLRRTEAPLGQLLRAEDARKEAYKTAVAERDNAVAQLAQFDGALPSRMVDPTKVRASRWANRHALSFETAEFVQLRAEIEQAGGNVQPIKIRPLAGSDEFEIVFGHRRHRACLELGIPVLATIESIGDQQLWTEMERENRQRADLSPWEQGVHYKRALDEGLFPSQRRLAESVGLATGTLSKVLTVAELPQVILDAFVDPNTIQMDWGGALRAAYEADPTGVQKRALQIKYDAVEPHVSSRNMANHPKAIYRQLTNVSSRNIPEKSVDIAGADGKPAARIKAGKGGKFSIEVIDSKLKVEQVEAAIRKLLKL